MASQLEGLLDEVWRCEEDERLNDRIDLALGMTRHGKRHVCALPTDITEETARSYTCPGCGQKWRKPFFYGWTPE